LPVISKIFEKLFLSRMLKFLDKHNQLSDDQFGFRKGKSTIDAVVSLVEMIVEGLENRNTTSGVFLDLSKAFDCVDHNSLLDKLELHGIRGLPHLWLRSFLSHRSQVVQISNKLSNPIKMRYGVPQGSILSPILFLVYVNDIGSSLLRGRLIQFADDTTLCFRAQSNEVLEQHAFVDINNCVQYFQSLNLATNSSKSNVVNFSLRELNSTNNPDIMIADSLLDEVQSTKFLGIHLDKGLTWNKHIDSLCAKLSSGIYALRSLAKYCPSQVLMTAYYGLIYPHLSYGVVIWGACANYQFQRLFKLQKKAIRIIAKIHFRESCRPAFKKLKLLTLPSIYILETTMFAASKCALMRGRDVHNYETRGRDNYRTERHRTVVYEHLPSQRGVHFINRLPNSIKNAPTPKAVKTRLKRCLASAAFRRG
jgi:hypothetical protein